MNGTALRQENTLVTLLFLETSSFAPCLVMKVIPVSFLKSTRPCASFNRTALIRSDHKTGGFGHGKKKATKTFGSSREHKSLRGLNDRRLFL
jgi:hypothetical protein